MITQQFLREILHYDPGTGVFKWRKPVSNRVRAGEKAGSLSAKGYLCIQISGKIYKAHRLAWLYVYGEWPNGEIDHVNRHKGDDRILNLRDRSKSGNMANTGIRRSNTSGHRGVTFNKSADKWQAQMYYDGKNHHLGYFDNPKEAAEVYKARFKEINEEEFRP